MTINLHHMAFPGTINVPPGSFHTLERLGESVSCASRGDRRLSAARRETQGVVCHAERSLQTFAPMSCPESASRRSHILLDAAVYAEGELSGRQCFGPVAVTPNTRPPSKQLRVSNFAPAVKHLDAAVSFSRATPLIDSPTFGSTGG